MKCDNLKAFNCVDSDVQDFCEPRLVYSKSEVDTAIAELKCELSDARDDARSSRNLINDKNEEIKELEDKVQQKDFFWDGCFFSKMGFKNTIDVANYVDSLKAENRKLKSALWLTRADRAKATWQKILRDAGILFSIGKSKEWDFYNTKQKKWQRVETKCRAKAEEFV